jgi:hypothetical protein
MTLGRVFLGLLAILIALTSAYRYWRTAEDEHIFKRLNGVNEITLQYDPTNAGEVYGPVLGLGYARWANFSRILYEGNSYYQVGVAATLVKKNTQPTRYIVREGFRLRSGPMGMLRYATLRVEDQETKAIIATKEWLCNGNFCNYAPEGVQGWPGQFAVKFVRDVLNPDKSIGGSIGVTPYPQTVTTLKKEDTQTSIAQTKLTSKTLGCPADVKVEMRINKDMQHGILTRSDWTYIPQEHVHQVICEPEGIFVFSWYIPDHVSIDLLTPKGELLGQYQIKTDIRSNLYYQSAPFISEFKIQPDTMEFRISYVPIFLKPEQEGNIMPKWSGLARISLNNKTP